VHITLYLQHLAVAEKVAGKWSSMGTCNVWRVFPNRFTINFRGFNRKLTKLVNKQLIVQDAQKKNTLASLKLAAACHLSFAEFLKFDELSKLLAIGLAIRPEYTFA